MENEGDGEKMMMEEARKRMRDGDEGAKREELIRERGKMRKM